MRRKLTQEFIESEVEKKGYKLLNKYVNAKTKLILQDKKEYLYVAVWSDFSKGKIPSKFHKSNPYTIQNIKLWMKTNAKGYELLSLEYLNNSTKLQFKCPKGHEFEMTWSNFQQGKRCSVCTRKQVTLENCIATTDPWMIKYFKNEEDAYTYSSGSGDIVSVVCPYCGKEKEMRILSIYKRKSIACICNDSVSYPEKFMISILNQLNIRYIKEYRTNWSNNKKYDFYLEDYNCIIECHGEQHYNENGFKSCNGRTLQEEQENDKYKKELAEQNGVDYYIILDCRESTLEQIKNSILNSQLNNLFDLNKIDWLQCEEYALSNRVKEVCDYWYLHNEINNEELSTKDIGNIFNLSYNTIIRYLKKGTTLSWCNYNSKEESKKASGKGSKKTSKPVEILKNGESLGVFESCSELSKQSEKLFGVKLYNSPISVVCRGKLKQYKGFTFRYISKEEYEKRIKTN